MAEWDAAPTTSIQFSADGRRVLHLSRQDNRITVLDAAGGVPVWTFQSTGASTQTRAVFTPDGQAVLSFFNKERHQWHSTRDGSIVRPSSIFDGTNGFTFNPDGTRLISTSEKGVVQCWESKEGGRLLFQFQPESRAVRDMTYTQDGRHILTLVMLPGTRQSIKVWDAHSGLLMQTLMGGSGDGVHLRMYPLTNEIIVAGQTTKVWQLPVPKEKHSFTESVAGLKGVFWGSDDLLLTDRSAMPTALFDLTLPAPRNQPVWEDDSKQNAKQSSVSADGRFAVLVARTGTLDRPTKLLQLHGRTVETVKTFTLQSRDDKMQLSPDGSLFWVESRLLNPATGEMVTQLESSIVKSHNAAAWLGYTRLVAALTTDQFRGLAGSKEQLVLWDATTGKLMQSVVNPSAILCLAGRPDAPWFAEAGTDKMVRLRDATTLEVKREFRAHDAPTTAMALHPKLPILATASDDLTVKLWNLETGRCLEEYRSPPGQANRLDISPGGKRLACWTDKLTRVWEPAAFREDATAAPDEAEEGWEDLLARFTPANFDPISNGWLLHRGVLFSPGTPSAGLPLAPGFAGKSYQVRVKLRRLASGGGLSMGLPVADSMVTFALDGWPEGDQCWTALSVVNGKTGKESPGAVAGRQVRDTAEHVLEVGVRLAGTNCTITAVLDGKPLYEWTGPHVTLSRHSAWKTPSGTLSLGTMSGNWSVSELRFKRLEK